VISFYISGEKKNNITLIVLTIAPHPPPPLLSKTPHSPPHSHFLQTFTTSSLNIKKSSKNLTILALIQRKTGNTKLKHH
jgi:hypothetical protein